MRWCSCHHLGILNPTTLSLSQQPPSPLLLLLLLHKSHPLGQSRIQCKRIISLALAPKSSQPRVLDLQASKVLNFPAFRVLQSPLDRGVILCKHGASTRPRVWPLRRLASGSGAQSSSSRSTTAAVSNADSDGEWHVTKSVSKSEVRKVIRKGQVNRLACPGCGVYMQDKNPQAPGFFKRPASLEASEEVEKEDVTEADEDIYEEEEELDGDEFDEEVKDVSEIKSAKDLPDKYWVLKNGKWEEVDEQLEDEVDDDLDGFRSVGPGFGRWNEIGAGNQDAKNAWNKELNSKFRFKTAGKEGNEEGERLVVCARCHSLRSYGQVKDESLENLLPEFDFEQAVGTRLMKAYGRRAVVVMVIDAVDFDGSFPRRVAALLSEADKKYASAWKVGASGNVPRLIVVATKVDLLPGQISPVRLEHWVRRRVVDGGAPRPSGVHLVSSKKGWGLKALAEQVVRLCGPRGDVWVVGSQNAGKSSLINALGKLSGQTNKPSTQLTEAPVPGTTIGILKLEGILPAKARLYDTPGILHPHQLTTRLSREELKLVQPRKELKPRTFRVKVGNTIHVGGLMRLDIVKTPSETIYVTVWASPLVPCHLGKTEKAEEILEKHIGERLQPPLDKTRLPELGKWLPRMVQVSGENWAASSIDIAVAGIGWVAFALKGEATLSVWTYEGVAVTRHEAMVFDMATVFEKPGFTVDKGPAKVEAKIDLKSNKEKRTKALKN